MVDSEPVARKYERGTLVVLNQAAPVSAYEHRLTAAKTRGLQEFADGQGLRFEVWGVRRRAPGEDPPLEITTRGPQLPDVSARLRLAVAAATHFVLVVGHRRRRMYIGDKLTAIGAVLALWLVRDPAPVVITVNAASAGDGLRRRGHRIAARLVGVIEHFTLRRADLVVTISAGTRAFVAAAGVPPDRILEAPVRVDWSQFAGTPDVVRDEHLVLCVARLVRQKGVDVLVRAIARVHEQVPAVRLEIAGDGELRNDLEALVAELGLESVITFHGHLKGRFMHELYARGSIVVLPSRAGEGLGRVLIEAGLAGCVPVGSNVQGINEVITPGVTGELVPPDDPIALADLLVELLRDAPRRDRLARGAGEVVRAHQERREAAGHEWRERMDALVATLVGADD